MTSWYPAKTLHLTVNQEYHLVSQIFNLNDNKTQHKDSDMYLSLHQSKSKCWYVFTCLSSVLCLGCTRQKKLPHVCFLSTVTLFDCVFPILISLIQFSKYQKYLNQKELCEPRAWLVTARKSSWGKVMFSMCNVSVHKGSVHRKRGGMGRAGGDMGDGGGMHVTGDVWQEGGAYMVGGMHVRGVCGGVDGRGHAWQGVCVAGETATAVGGTHPTGMHSCSRWVQQIYIYN